jgi:folate-dependent phosphoribosylglycinamide formyltransferase PurN
MVKDFMPFRPWVAFFSQSGKEIVDIATKLERWPDLIVTNDRPSKIRQIDRRIVNCKVIKNRPSVEDYQLLEFYNNPIITLHGWLRVVPPSICSKYEIYNGHPGLITEYEELKGKDPQVRAFQGKYPTIGSVIHKVVEGIDEGDIVSEGSISSDNLDLENTFLKLREVSLILWLKFLSRIFYEEGSCPSWIFKYWQEYDIRTIKEQTN